MQRLIEPKAIFNEFIEEIYAQYKFLPPFNISWTHNIHSIMAKMGRKHDFIPWYEDTVHKIGTINPSKESRLGRFDCSWFNNDEDWEEILVMEYENDPYCNIERIEHDVNKLVNAETDYALRVIIYFTNASDAYDINKWTFKSVDDFALQFESDLEKIQNWIFGSIDQLPLNHKEGRYPWLIISFGGISPHNGKVTTIFLGYIFNDIRMNIEKEKMLKSDPIEVSYTK